MVQNGTLDPTLILTEVEPLTGAIEAYKAFDARRPGWIKVELDPDLLRVAGPGVRNKDEGGALKRAAPFVRPATGRY
jgi:hypothetical protein